VTENAPKASNWNVPNALTALRIVMVPFFGYALLQDGGDSIAWRCTAAAIFILGMATDKIDGDIARKRNLITDFGKIADPIADKAMTGMAFIGLTIVGEVWLVATVLVLLREWSITLLRLSVAKDVVIAATQSGKIKTVLQAGALSWLSFPLVADDHAWGTPGEVVFYLSQAMLAAAVAMTLWSGYEFYRDFWQQRHVVRATGPESP